MYFSNRKNVITITDFMFRQLAEQQQAMREAKTLLQKDKADMTAQLRSGQHQVISCTAPEFACLLSQQLDLTIRSLALHTYPINVTRTRFQTSASDKNIALSFLPLAVSQAFFCCGFHSKTRTIGSAAKRLGNGSPSRAGRETRTSAACAAIADGGGRTAGHQLARYPYS